MGRNTETWNEMSKDAKIIAEVMCYCFALQEESYMYALWQGNKQKTISSIHVNIIDDEKPHKSMHERVK